MDDPGVPEVWGLSRPAAARMGTYSPVDYSPKGGPFKAAPGGAVQPQDDLGTVTAIMPVGLLGRRGRADARSWCAAGSWSSEPAVVFREKSGLSTQKTVSTCAATTLGSGVTPTCGPSGEEATLTRGVAAAPPRYSEREDQVSRV